MFLFDEATDGKFTTISGAEQSAFEGTGTKASSFTEEDEQSLTNRTAVPFSAAFPDIR